MKGRRRLKSYHWMALFRRKDKLESCSLSVGESVEQTLVKWLSLVLKCWTVCLCSLSTQTWACAIHCAENRKEQDGEDSDPIPGLEEPVVKEAVASILLPDTSTVSLSIKNTTWWCLAYYHLKNLLSNSWEVVEGRGMFKLLKREKMGRITDLLHILKMAVFWGPQN